ncbi:MAG: TIGR03016 family PEP-CTERM system-associated outer membrane protein, partial [Alphaproteobacteria bacterium]|nr:TIGR03016 family PEP-CTERM system-associated outer membrane protein [Alphaproteobacteria bacterium]
MQDSAAYKTAGSTHGGRGHLPKALGRDWPGRVSLLVLVVGVLILAGPVAAGNLTITPTIELRETYSDNVDLDPDGQDQAALTSEIVPGVTLRSESARVTAALDAFPIIRHQTAGSDEGVSIAGGLAGFGTVEALEDLFFIAAQASISQEVLSSRQAASSANEETVQVYRLSPYLRNRFGGFAEGEARYRISQVLVGGQEGAAATSDSTTQSLHLSLDSGADFTRFRWSVNALAS